MLSQDENEPVEKTFCPLGHECEFSIERDFIITRCTACNNLVTIYQRWECPFCKQTETLMGQGDPFFAVQLCEPCDKLMVVGSGLDNNNPNWTFFLTPAEQAKFLALVHQAQWQEAAKEVLGSIKMFELAYNIGNMAEEGEV